MPYLSLLVLSLVAAPNYTTGARIFAPANHTSDATGILLQFHSYTPNAGARIAAPR